MIGISTFFVCFIIVFIYKQANGLNNDFTNEMLLPNGEIYSILSSTPTIILAFTFQFNAFPIYYSLKEMSHENMMKATYLGVYFCAGIYLLVGVLGYLSYGDTMVGSVLNSLLNDLKIHKEDVFLRVILLLVAFSFLISSTMSIPILFFSLKSNFINTVIFCRKKLCGGVPTTDSETQKKIDDLNHLIEEKEAEVESVEEPGKKKSSSSEDGGSISPDKKNSAASFDRKSVFSVLTQKEKQEIKHVIEHKYVSDKWKVVIIISLFIGIVALTILIKLLSTVSSIVLKNFY